ncbi:multidrug ABC transporter permease [Agrilactobacillus composti DSM 18527 = JCM 14202]|uniref:Multidrug ABC transporter permease n=1 Tax=Agrilactobacillus composti DSM 18527 = JCM 14202 TaxID=1423734 RepID=A0A0R1XK18_9LACO|nr:ABC transporter permease [Agrilactobacillus composti]KRM30535.1 multidrug ABC transporter permease [Agrilactobacillus composti DSM 18527 = JCM 14202]
MLAFTKRNLTLYFGNRATVFFSILGALIAFILYLVFLRNTVINSIPINNISAVLDPWIVGGTLTIVAITTSQIALSQMIMDRQQGRLADFVMTGTPYWQIQGAYLMGAILISFLMQILVFFIMYGYFVLADGIILPWTLLPQVLLTALLSSGVWTAFNLLVFSFVEKTTTASQLSTIVGTAAGFFAGVYIPIGSMPAFAQTISKFTPAPYNSALFRQLLMDPVLDQKFSGHLSQARATLAQHLGVTISLNQDLASWQVVGVMMGFLVVFVIFALIFSKHSRLAAISRV